MSFWSRLSYCLRCSLIVHGRCRRATRLLLEDLDGRLTPREVALLHRHLQECRQCGLEAVVHARVKRSLARGGRPPDVAVQRLQEFAGRLLDDDTM